MEYKIKFHPSHDLVYLLKLASKEDSGLLEYKEKAGSLTQYEMLARYPIEYPPASREEAKEAVETAEEIIDFIKKKVQYAQVE